LGWVGHGQAQDEARGILDKAIKANGGEETLRKHKAGQMKGKGSIELAGGLAFTSEVTYLMPDKIKESIELEVNGQKINVVTVFNGEKVSFKVNGQEMKADDKILAEIKEVGHLVQVSRLVALKDKAYELTPLGEAKVEGKAAVGLRVVRQ